VSYYIVSGYGFEVELRSSLGEEAAKRRAMWTLISAGHLEPSGSPETMMAGFTVEARVACRGGNR
jgi:hypothetical protein